MTGTAEHIIDLKQPEFYFNRELSLLEFNRRVLSQALDENTPLLERLRFLCISSTNMDEFFEVRVAGLKQKAEIGSVQADPDNMAPQEVLNAIGDNAHVLVDEQYHTLNEILIPELEKEQIRFIRRSDWSEDQESWLRNFFENELLPVLSPLGLDPAHPFPRILNKSLCFIVSLKGKDAFGRSGGFAVVQAPRSLPRIIQLPARLKGNGPYDFVFLSSVIHAHVDALFPGMKVTGCYQFRATRNSDLFVDEEEIDDLLRAVEGELASRRYGAVVRLETADDCPDDLVQFLLGQFNLKPEDHYRANGPVNLNRLSAVCDIVDRPDLKYPGFTPSLPGEFAAKKNIFDVIRRRDVLLHHPFQSFLPVVDFLKTAARDPNVLAIKQTLYRTGPESAVVDALVDAAQAGKEVTVVIELRARFDEAENITLANRLQEAGAQVVYGVVGYKTHAKMILVVRREGKGLRHYVHMGTGNYHHRTARLYTDYGLFSADREIGEDIHNVFLQLTSIGKVSKLNKILQSPFTLHDTLIQKIQREAANARAGKPARIIAKFNSLVEPQLVQACYEASQAGVEIDLIIRGVCILRPGVPGVSENIRVRSVIGRFLEHTRIYYFENSGEPEVYGASADWMGRNMFRRVEIAFPFESKRLRERVVAELNYYIQDNAQAWELQEDGKYRLRQSAAGDKTPVFSAQAALLAELAEN
ncbi:MAG: polyphosphate kinase [Acidithiobacillales bacterium SG8_45]|nr:MAG: polyphosphate kinase [Acidithiobacillales bacterium SG8_45]